MLPQTFYHESRHGCPHPGSRARTTTPLRRRYQARSGARPESRSPRLYKRHEELPQRLRGEVLRNAGSHKDRLLHAHTLHLDESKDPPCWIGSELRGSSDRNKPKTTKPSQARRPATVTKANISTKNRTHQKGVTQRFSTKATMSTLQKLQRRATPFTET